MDNPFQRACRIVGIGSAFVLFGIGGLLLSISALPILRLLGGDSDQRERRVQRLIRRCYGAFMGYMHLMGLSEIHVQGIEKLHDSGPHLLVANHPSLLDVVVIGSLLPQMDCVIKLKAWKNPVMRGPVTAAGYIPNDSGEQLVDHCVERLEQGRSLLIFPEGTRSPKGGLGHFQRGAAHMALRSGRPLRPISVRCDPPTLMRGQKWYDVPPCRMRFSIEVGDALAPAAPAQDEPRAVTARRMTAELRVFFAKKLQNPAVREGGPSALPKQDC